MLRKIRVRTNCSNYCPIFFFVLVFNLFNVIKVSELRTKLLNPNKISTLTHRTPTSRIPIIIVKLAFFLCFKFANDPCLATDSKVSRIMWITWLCLKLIFI